MMQWPDTPASGEMKNQWHNWQSAMVARHFQLFGDWSNSVNAKAGPG